MKRGSAGIPRSPSGHGGHDADLVAGVQGRSQTLVEADILAVDVHVDEPPQLARLVTQALLQARVLPLQRIDAGHQGAPVAGNHVHLVGQLAQGRGNSYGHAHLFLYPSTISPATGSTRTPSSTTPPTPLSISSIPPSSSSTTQPRSSVTSARRMFVTNSKSRPSRQITGSLISPCGKVNLTRWLANVASYFRVAGKAPVRSLRASSNDVMEGCMSRRGRNRGATAS